MQAVCFVSLRLIRGPWTRRTAATDLEAARTVRQGADGSDECASGPSLSRPSSVSFADGPLRRFLPLFRPLAPSIAPENPLSVLRTSSTGNTVHTTIPARENRPSRCVFDSFDPLDYSSTFGAY